MTKAGLEVRPHDGRATYGNRLRRKKVPLETIATLMRHENLDTTFKSYIGYDMEELRGAQDILCPSDKSQRGSTREKDLRRLKRRRKPSQQDFPSFLKAR